MKEAKARKGQKVNEDSLPASSVGLVAVIDSVTQGLRALQVLLTKVMNL